MSPEETFKVPVICQLVDLVDRNVISGKSYMHLAYDLTDIAHAQFHLAGAEASGRYFEPVVSDPKKYIIKQTGLRGSLQQLKSKGIKLFIVSNNNAAYTDIVLRETLGSDWSQLFDIKIANSRKPLF